MAALNVMSIVGNRPQLVKSAPLVTCLARSGVRHTIVYTADRRETIPPGFLEELGLHNSFVRLDAGVTNSELLDLSIAEVLFEADPDLVLAYGDSITTLSATRAAIEAGVVTAHVEAGTRCGDLSLPEEQLRIAVDTQSALLFCSDERSYEALQSENVSGDAQIVGDVLVDASRQLQSLARKKYRPSLEPRSYIAATIQRAENLTGDRLQRILAGLSILQLPVLLVTEPYIRSHITAHRVRMAPTVHVIEPMPYVEFMSLLRGARVVVTDSGNLQREAYVAGVPCVTLRSQTEWAATIEVGANVLVDDDPEAISGAALKARPHDARLPIFGDGHAAERIAALIIERAAR